MLRSSLDIQWLGLPHPSHTRAWGGVGRGRDLPPPAALQSVLAWAGQQTFHQSPVSHQLKTPSPPPPLLSSCLELVLTAPTPLAIPLPVGHSLACFRLAAESPSPGESQEGRKGEREGRRGWRLPLVPPEANVIEKPSQAVLTRLCQATQPSLQLVRG